jgi:hypothetical protein
MLFKLKYAWIDIILYRRFDITKLEHAMMSFDSSAVDDYWTKSLFIVFH